MVMAPSTTIRHTLPISIFKHKLKSTFADFAEAFKKIDYSITAIKE